MNWGQKMADDGEMKAPSKWGKGKTDPATHWKKGCKSPNPLGRKKGTKNQKTLYREAFEKKITVTMDGEPMTMSKKALTYHQIAQKAAAGEMKAIAIQMMLDEKFDPGETAPPTVEESAADFATFDSWLALREKYSVFAKKADGDV